MLRNVFVKNRWQKQLFALATRLGKSQKEKTKVGDCYFSWRNITLFSIYPRLAGESHISIIGERLVRRWSKHALLYELVAAISMMLRVENSLDILHNSLPQPS